MKILLIGLGGFLGAIARYGASGLVQKLAGAAFPLGTLFVNVAGCLAIGACMCMVEERELLTPAARLFFLVGFLGSFTTFSTFGYETLEMLRTGQWLPAAVYAAANLILGIGAVFAGWSACRATFGNAL